MYELIFIGLSGPILESKGMCAIFQKKEGQKGKKVKIFQNLSKNVQNLQIFWKRETSFMCVTIACMKQLEYALAIVIWHFEILYKYKHVYHIFFDRKGLVIGDIR